MSFWSWKLPAYILLIFNINFAQQAFSVYSHISVDAMGQIAFFSDKGVILADETPGKYSIKKLTPVLQGTEDGISIQYPDTTLNGILYYGFIDYKDGLYPLPIFFKKYSKIISGKTFIPIKKNLRGKYDIIEWEKNKKGVIGYRVQEEYGKLLYEGRLNFSGSGPFKVEPCIIEGPFVNLVTEESVVISLTTDSQAVAMIKVGDRFYSEKSPVTNHEIMINGLKAGSEYSYTVILGTDEQTYRFKTSPKNGSRQPFVFAYASDSRSGVGGGERDVYGTNYYITKKIAALASFKNAAFMQFTGDLITGYSADKDEMNLQYANWKRVIEPFAHYMPVYTAMGNHEALIYKFPYEGLQFGVSIDRFPYDSESSEALFADNFVLPENGPISEDGAEYDPDKKDINFPSYKENVYYYTYDNVAMIVLNPDYWYAPSLKYIAQTGGNLHGYIMDNQLKWFSGVLKKFENDNNIDHIFVTFHTPLLPNGGHLSDCMWYKGDNSKRSIVSGKPVQYGIIERRDQLMDLMINKSKKVVAVLTGDEHNYCRLKIAPGMNIYPQNYNKKKLDISRTIWQINNGAAGAPYYALQETPWSANVKRFSTQNALVLIYVDGKKVKIEVLNPDTLDLIDKVVLLK